jgi:hypothetical protein
LPTADLLSSSLESNDSFLIEEETSATRFDDCDESDEDLSDGELFCNIPGTSHEDDKNEDKSNKTASVSQNDAIRFLVR